MKILKLFLGAILLLTLTGCPFDGDSGSNGVDGINCWDLNENRTNDPDEDINNDGLWNVNDCSPDNAPSQNAEVVYNHQHFCEAFANLGQYPSGCPSNSHSPPAGTLTLQLSSSWYDDGMGNYFSCSQPPSNGPVSIRPDTDGHYWVVEGGFIARKETIDGVDEIQNARCFNNCLLDADCIASWAVSKQVGTARVYECYHFHHSDTVSPWKHLCGPELQDCFDEQSSENQRWSARCP